MTARRCPWSALIFVGSGEVADSHMHYVRCRKRNRWWSRWLRAWHLHDAQMPPCIAGQPTVTIRWRSSTTADYHHAQVDDGAGCTADDLDPDLASIEQSKRGGVW